MLSDFKVEELFLFFNILFLIKLFLIKLEGVNKSELKEGGEYKLW